MKNKNIIGKINLAIQFAKEVKELFAQSKTISAQKNIHEQLIGLPEPVQRYFKHVLKEGQPYSSYVRLKHTGQFKTGVGKDWINIEGEQYFTTEKPGFIWKGTTALMTARDKYMGDRVPGLSWNYNGGKRHITELYIFLPVDGYGGQMTGILNRIMPILLLSFFVIAIYQFLRQAAPPIIFIGNN